MQDHGNDSSNFTKENEETPSELIERYISQKKSMQFATVQGISFLRYCIAMIDEELAIEIVENGLDVDINEPWDNGQTPMHFAAQMDMSDLIKAIFKHRAKEIDLFAQTDDFLVQFNDFQCGGKSILHYAAMNGATDICKLLIEFEQNEFKSNKLLFIKDFEGNDAIDEAVMHRKYDTAKNLLLARNDIESKIDIDEWIQKRAKRLKKKRLDDSKSTRMRFEKQNKDLIVSKDDLMNKTFVLKNLWNEQRCKYILDKVNAFGDVNGWTTQRHRSYATTDIPSHSIGHDLDEYVRKLLYQTLYPQIIEKYGLNERFGVNEANGEYVEIGVRDLFFVKYDMLRQRQLELHRDGSLVSFNILLNDSSEFGGGGTYFKHLDKVIEIEKGDCCIHSGKVLHAGHPINKGKRYILVGFLDGKIRKMKQNGLNKSFGGDSFAAIHSF